MGGNTFAAAYAPGHPTLWTPRISPDNYKRLRDMIKDRLKRYYPSAHVWNLIEAPEKSDYGDIDFVVGTDQTMIAEKLAHRIGAKAVVINHGFISLAVPMPDDFPENPKQEPILYELSNKPHIIPTMKTSVPYAQVDIVRIQPHLARWYRFYSSYGDLGSIIGRIVRSCGFTMTDKGFFLRFELLEDAKQRQYFRVKDDDGMLLLSNDPQKVMAFLGLNSDTYDKGFTKLERLFDWLGECRMLTKEYVQMTRDLSRDRQREKKRTMFTKFFDEWLSTHKKANGTTDPNLEGDDRRGYYQDEAVKFFRVQDDFVDKLLTLQLSLVNQQAEHLLRPWFRIYTELNDKKITELIRAFRRWVCIDHDTFHPYVACVQHRDAESELWKLHAPDLLALDFDNKPISEFIQNNWEEIRSLERHHQSDAKPVEVEGRTVYESPQPDVEGG